ncbi:hypothetical protein EYS14_15590 [Alteromonadaceae bacterium M269]|nr:hypothetical protein EYS14_15590 [Alteromonadaceae bacterium M269]
MDVLSVLAIGFLATFFFNVLPCILALLSSKAAGLHKVAWFVLAFFLSWLGYLVYYFVVIKDPSYRGGRPRYDSMGRIIR